MILRGVVKVESFVMLLGWSLFFFPLVVTDRDGSRCCSRNDFGCENNTCCPSGSICCKGMLYVHHLVLSIPNTSPVLCIALQAEDVVSMANTVLLPRMETVDVVQTGQFVLGM